MALTDGRLALAAGFAYLLLAGSARAAPITWDFSGIVRSDSPELAGLVGSPFSGSITFESTTADSVPDPTAGVYYDAITSLELSLGPSMTLSLAAGGTNLILVGAEFVTSGFPNFYYFHMDLERNDAPQELFFLHLGFNDSDGDVISTDTIMLSPPDLAFLDPYDPNDFFDPNAIGDVTGIQLLAMTGDPNTSGIPLLGELVEIPEPSTWSLLAGAVAGLGLLCGRQRFS